MNAIVTSWSDFHRSLDEMPKRLKWKEQRAWIYRNLLRRPKQRFSTFEVSENMLVASRVTDMFNQGIIESISGDFPWTKYCLHVKRTKPRPEKPIRCVFQWNRLEMYDGRDD